MKKNVLFVSHDASRTGAPIVLKHILTWLKANDTLNFSLLIKGGDADIEPDFEKIAKVYRWNPSKKRKGVFSKVKRKLLGSGVYEPYPQQLLNQKFDAIYLNTVASTDLIPYLKAFHNCPVILHVHENEYSIKAFYANSLSESFVKHVDQYIAVSQSTRNNLVENFGIPTDRVIVINECVQIDSFKAPTKPVGAVKKRLGISNEFVVGGCGAISWRKGPDLFLQTAQKIQQVLGKGMIKFVWVGHADKAFIDQMKYEMPRMGLTEGEVIFTGSVADPENYFQIFDVFAMTSREDPFPLVCLEAAALGKPIICFENSGGIPEWLQGNGGIIVPYADTQAMAHAVIDLYQNKEKQNNLSGLIQKSVQAYDVNQIAPQVLSVITSVVNV